MGKDEMGRCAVLQDCRGISKILSWRPVILALACEGRFEGKMADGTAQAKGIEPVDVLNSHPVESLPSSRLLCTAVPSLEGDQ